MAAAHWFSTTFPLTENADDKTATTCTTDQWLLQYSSATFLPAPSTVFAISEGGVGGDGGSNISIPSQVSIGMIIAIIFNVHYWRHR